MARPKLQIDPKLVEQFASIGCKTKEIANFLGCNEDTITNRFSAELLKGRTNLKMSLRRWQLESAKKGNVVMQIWLGKQLLGQSESPHDDEGNELDLQFTKYEDKTKT